MFAKCMLNKTRIGVSRQHSRNTAWHQAPQRTLVPCFAKVLCLQDSAVSTQLAGRIIQQRRAMAAANIRYPILMLGTCHNGHDKVVYDEKNLRHAK